MLFPVLDMQQFFASVYTDLLLLPIIGVGTLFFVAAAAKLGFGHRDAAEKLGGVGLMLFLIGFAPMIVALVWNLIVKAGGGKFGT